MWIQQKNKVRVFGVAMILALMCACGVPAFEETAPLADTAGTTSPYVLVATPSSLTFTGAVGSSPACQRLVQNDTTPTAPLPVAMSTDAAWLTVTPTVGNSQVTLSACLKIAGLAAGTYTGHIITTMTAPNSAGETVNNSPYSIPVMLVITAGTTSPYILVATPNALSFTGAVGSSPSCQRLVQNDTTPSAPLPVAMSTDAAWLTVTPTVGNSAVTLSACVKTTGLAVGTYAGHIITTVTAPNSAGQTVSNSPYSIPVTLAVTAGTTTSPYVLVATPNALTFTGAVGSSPACQRLVQSDTTPSAPLPVAMSTDAAWLTVTPTVGNSQVTLSACVKTAGLAAGTYRGHIITIVTAPNSAGETVNNSPYSIPVMLVVTGASTSPYVLVATPSSLTFTGAVGSSPACQNLLQNDTTPTAPLPVAMSTDAAWLTVTPTVGNSAVTLNACVKTTGLAAGTYTGHIITIMTAPNSAGETVSNSPYSIPVTLVVGSSSRSTLGVNPTSVAFGNINLGNNNTKTVTLTNSGTGSVTISQVNGVGGGLSGSGIATPMVLSAGQTTVLSIMFAPTAAGSVNGTVSVVSDATNSPAVIAATGTGVQASLTASPSTLNFGNVTTGNSGSQVVTLSNNGSVAASISQASVSGTGYTVSGIALPMSLAAGASTTFTVRFAPTVAGTVGGSVTVASNTPNSPTLIGLSGTGAAAASHSVSLTWVASTSTVVGYNIYRGSASGGPYTVLNSAPNSGLSYTDTSVLTGQTYFYVVTAVDAAGTESVVSNEVQVIIP